MKSARDHFLALLDACCRLKQEFAHVQNHRADGREYGPVSADQLRRWMGERRLNAQTLVRAEGTADWKPLGSVPEFSLWPGSSAAPSAFAVPPAPRRTNSMALTGLIFALIAVTFGMCCCYGFPFNVLGVIFSLIGLSQIRQSPEIYDGHGIAIAGLVISILSIAAAIGITLLFGSISVMDSMPRHIHTL